MTRTQHLIGCLLGGAFAVAVWASGPTWLAVVVTVSVLAYITVGAVARGARA